MDDMWALDLTKYTVSGLGAGCYPNLQWHTQWHSGLWTAASALWTVLLDGLPGLTAGRSQ